MTFFFRSIWNQKTRSYESYSMHVASVRSNRLRCLHTRDDTIQNSPFLFLPFRRRTRRQISILINSPPLIDRLPTENVQIPHWDFYMQNFSRLFRACQTRTCMEIEDEVLLVEFLLFLSSLSLPHFGKQKKAIDKRNNSYTLRLLSFSMFHRDHFLSFVCAPVVQQYLSLSS